MATVCIFTPTYNRAYTLERLYQSLVAQTCRDFSWLVVDDGSTDGTRELIEGFQREHVLDIGYELVENGGKQRAMNLGVALCEDELFFCLDSDDYLVPDAVEAIVDAWEKVRSDASCAGIVALRGSDADTPLTGYIKEGLGKTTLWDLYNKTPFTGDVALAHRTEILKRYPYEVDDREKFISETIVYYAIDQTYTLLTMNKVLTVCKYLEDGYSKNVRKLTKDNPIGYMRHHKACEQLSGTLYGKWYHRTLWLVGCLLAAKRYGKDCEGLVWPAFDLLEIASYPVALLLLATEFR